MQTREFRKWCRLVEKVENDNTVLFCYRGSGPARHLSGNGDHSPMGEEKESRDGSLLVS